MRKLLLFFIPILFFSCKKNNEMNLPCESFYFEQKDEFTNEVLFSSKDVELENENNKIIGRFKFISNDLKQFKIPILLDEKICTDEFSKVIFLFEDKSTSGYFIQPPYSCDGSIMIDKPIHKDFKNKLIKGIRVQGSASYIDYHFNQSTKEKIKKTVSCYFNMIELKKND